MMTGVRRPALALVGLVALEGLAGCGLRPAQSSASAALEQACRSQADRVYDEQHRDALSRGQDDEMEPASSTGLIQFPGQSLGDEYARDQDVQSCITRRTASTREGTSFGPGGAQ